MIRDEQPEEEQNTYKRVKMVIGEEKEEIVIVEPKPAKALITGSWHANSTEIYDYSNNHVVKGPDMSVCRRNHASVTLKTGEVVVFGGANSDPDGSALSSCEIFDPESVSFSAAGEMCVKRNGLAAVLLPSGLVLVLGGITTDGCYLSNECLTSCELFNPADKTFSLCKATMLTGRYLPTASLLADGTVLVCGGCDGVSTVQTTEIYNPKTDCFSAGPLMTKKRCLHTATTLPDGKVLLTGGVNFNSSDSTEMYDPKTNTFVAGPTMVYERAGHFAVLLNNGVVLLGGGSMSDARLTTELYHPIINQFTQGTDVSDRFRASAAALY